MDNLPLVVEATADFDVQPAILYDMLLDYEGAHAAFVPPKYINPMIVKQGGKGAGTVVECTFNVLGTKRVVEVEIHEPEPGRVMVEEDNINDFRTVFTVDPLANGTRSRLTIATYAKPLPGIRGKVELWVNGVVGKRIMSEEFGRIAQYIAVNPYYQAEDIA